MSVWGLGWPDEKKRSKMRVSPLEVVMKLHKKPVKTRPIAKAFASQLKALEGLLSNLLVQILEMVDENFDGRDVITGQEVRKPGIILKNSRSFTERVEELNKMWEGDTGGKGRIIELASWDVDALFPNMQIQYVIESVGEILEEVLQSKSGSEREKAEKLRETIMIILVFVLEHNFVSVVDCDEHGNKIARIYYQIQGIGIGSSASTLIANLTLLCGERKMLRRLWEKGFNILLYGRYIDDIFLVAVADKKKEGETFKAVESVLNNLDKGGSVRVTGGQIQANRVSEGGGGSKEELKGIEFLDTYCEFERNSSGQTQVGIGIFRKEAAADLYMQTTSAHSEACKRGLVKTELIRYISLCNSKSRFLEAWNRFEIALGGRGYSKEFIEGAKGGVSWKDRQNILNKQKSKQELDRMPVVVEGRPGVQEWWKDCIERGLAGFEGLNKEEKKYLLDGIIKSNSGTQK